MDHAQKGDEMEINWDDFDETKHFVNSFPDLSTIDDPEEAARVAYKYVRKHAELIGQKPDIETFMAKPGERDESFGNWWVCWEAGPYDWAIELTCATRKTYNDNWYCECYWGFDLIFVTK